MSVSYLPSSAWLRRPDMDIHETGHAWETPDGVIYFTDRTDVPPIIARVTPKSPPPKSGGWKGE